MKKSSRISTLFIILVLFFIDIFSFLVAEKPLLYGLFGLYVIESLKAFWFPAIALLLLLLTSESLIYYGNFIFPLMYLIPLYGIGRTIAKTCFIKKRILYLYLIVCLFGQIFILEYLFLGLPASIPYTGSKIFATVAILIVVTWFDH